MPRITDRDEIRSILETDRGWSVYALGDLSPGLFEQSEWYRPAGGAPALILIFRAFSIPVLFALGKPALLAAVLDEIGPESVRMASRPCGNFTRTASRRAKLPVSSTPRCSR
jgi:hypothetical protein